MLKLFILVCFFMLNSAAYAIEEIRFGAIIPLSGDAQEFGKEARLALEHALADSESKTFTYKLIIEDDQLSASKASLAARKLMEVDRVSVLFSNWSYGGNAVASVARDSPVISLANAWDRKILEVAENSFLISGPPDGLAKQLISKIKSENGKSMILFGFQEAGVVQAFDDIEIGAREAGIEILKRIEIDVGNISDVKSVALQAKQLKPDYFVACLIHPLFMELFKQFRHLQYSPSFASIGQAPFDPAFKQVLPTIWWSVDYKANLEDDEKIRLRTGLTDLSGYPAYYEAMRAIVTIYESSPNGKIPDISWVKERLSAYKNDTSLLGRIFVSGRRLHSQNATVIDQRARY